MTRTQALRPQLRRNRVLVGSLGEGIPLRTSELDMKSASISSPVLLSIIGVGLLFVSGWFGGQRVHGYDVGVKGRE